MKNTNLTVYVLIGAVLIGAGIYLFSGNQSVEEDKMVRTNVQDTNRQIVDTTKSETGSVDQKLDKENMKMPESNTIVDIAVSDPNFSTLVTALKEAGLVDTLAGEGPFTVFAPTNEAFAKIPEADLNEILSDKEQLTSILTYHVVAGKVMSSDVVNLSSAKTVQGSEVGIKVSGNNVMVDNANVIAVDIEADNGVIHVIDSVIIPQ